MFAPDSLFLWRSLVFQTPWPWPQVPKKQLLLVKSGFAVRLDHPSGSTYPPWLTQHLKMDGLLVSFWQFQFFRGCVVSGPGQVHLFIWYRYKWYIAPLVASLLPLSTSCYWNCSDRQSIDICKSATFLWGPPLRYAKLVLVSMPFCRTLRTIRKSCRCRRTSSPES